MYEPCWRSFQVKTTECIILYGYKLPNINYFYNKILIVTHWFSFKRLFNGGLTLTQPCSQGFPSSVEEKPWERV